jgi:carbonic anhydrase
MNKIEILDWLRSGNERYISDQMQHVHQHLETSKGLTVGQKPSAIILSCGDNGYNLNHLLSHIDPAMSKAGEQASVETVIRKNAE